MTTAVQPRPGPMGALRDIWQRNHDLLRNAGSLIATTGLTSVFGFVYWVVAARMFTKAEVGYGAAAVSAMTLIGTIGMFGLGTMLIGELPRRRERGGLISATVTASGIGSLVIGLGFAVVAAIMFRASFPEISGTPSRIALFVVGVGLTGATFVLDEGTIGLMRGGVQLWRNFAASAIKLAFLPIMAVLLHDTFGVGMEFAWVLGTVLSLVPTIIMLKRGGARIFHRPDWGLLRRLGKVAMAHNWLNLAIATPPKLMPVLVVLVTNSTTNAIFYDAWMMAGFLFMVPASLSTVLFAIASAAPELIAEKLRFVLRLSVLIGVPAMVVLAIGAHFALNLFGPGYAQLGTVPLWLFILTYIPGLPKMQYIAVSRATGRVNQAAVLLTVCALCELASVIIGGKLHGLIGLSIGYLCVMIVEGFVTAPTVLRAAYARGQQRKAATGAMAALPDSLRETTAGTGYLDRQESGLATLFAVAASAMSEGLTLDAAVEVWRTGAFPTVTGSFTAVTGDFPAVTGPFRPAPDRSRAIGPDAVRHRHRRNTTPATRAELFGDRPPRVDPEPPGYYSNQQAGMDALISMATPEPPDAYSPNGHSPNGHSPNGQSQNGRGQNGSSPNGQSPNGHSPNGQSPNGHSQNGRNQNGQSSNGWRPNEWNPNARRPNRRSPNGRSPNGQSWNGYSPNGQGSNGSAQNGSAQNGQSQNGKSRNGQSPNGQSPNGRNQNGQGQNGQGQNGQGQNGRRPRADDESTDSRK